jgi:hypothetical protein
MVLRFMAMERHCLFSDVSQTDSGVHPDSYSMTVEGTFLKGAAVSGEIAHSPAPTLRMSGGISPFPDTSW